MEEGEGCIHSREPNVQEVPQAGSGHRPHCASQSGRRVLGRDQLATAMQAMPRHQVGKRSALAKGVGVPRIYWVCGYIAAVYPSLNKSEVLSRFGQNQTKPRKRASSRPAMMSRRAHEGLNPPFPHPQKKPLHPQKRFGFHRWFRDCFGVGWRALVI